jgi:hypothetical protein
MLSPGVRPVHPSVPQGRADRCARAGLRHMFPAQGLPTPYTRDLGPHTYDNVSPLTVSSPAALSSRCNRISPTQSIGLTHALSMVGLCDTNTPSRYQQPRQPATGVAGFRRRLTRP